MWAGTADPPIEPGGIMKSFRMHKARMLWVGASVAIVVLASCAKSASSTASTAGGSGGTPGAAGSVKVSTASVAGMGTVLVDGKGFALYTLPSEASGGIKCTGACAANWPPLLLPAGSTTADAGSGVKAGDLGTIARPDSGMQVTYKGLPLYLYVGDQSAGQVTGDGVAGFSVATTSGGAASTASPSSSGHYGY